MKRRDAPSPPALSARARRAQVSQLHARLAQRWPALRSHLWERRGKPRRLKLDDALPPNPAIECIAAALAAAHSAHGARDAVVLFVVQPNERNAVDQLLLQTRLWDAHGVRSVSRTLAQIHIECRLDGPKRRLILGDGAEVAVAYFRAGYSPDDYPSAQQWDARLLIERSLAIKCPSAAYHLVRLSHTHRQPLNLQPPEPAAASTPTASTADACHRRPCRRAPRRSSSSCRSPASSNGSSRRPRR